MAWRVGLAAVAASIGGVATAEAPPTALRDAMLSAHNAARGEVGVAPLRWDEGLAADARAYAQTLAATRRFAHARQEGQGENLWMGTAGAYRHAEMAGHWVDERRWFRRAATPAFSTTGNWADVGHYTQIIWRDTRAVGCATAGNGRDDYLVCRYYPAGNVIGVDPLDAAGATSPRAERAHRNSARPKNFFPTV